MSNAWIIYMHCSEVGAKYREELKKLQEEAEKVKQIYLSFVLYFRNI